MSYIKQKIFYKSLKTVKTKLIMDCLPTSSLLGNNIQYGTNNYVQYIPGGVNSKLIISATHGGKIQPKEMPNRVDNFRIGNYNGFSILTKSDVYTKEMALLLREELIKLANIAKNKEPHLVICDLHRSKVDVNRDITEACLNVPEAMIAYNEFHDFLSQARISVNKGLLIDLHGHTHCEELVELGYLILKEDITECNLLPEKSSIRSLALNSTFPLKDLICGTASLGKFLQDEGIETFPSPKYQQTQGFCFTGGYTILRHGSHSAGCVDAIQIEIHKKYRNKEESPIFISLLAKAIKQFMDLHYGGI